MRHLEKVIIFAIMVMVLIYTVTIDRTIPYSQKRIVPIATEPPSTSRPITRNKASFFPESEPSLEDESIIEETFTEVP